MTTIYEEVEKYLNNNNFRSQVRETGKEVYKNIVAGNIEEANELVKEELYGWLEFTTDLTYYNTLDIEDSVIVLYMLDSDGFVKRNRVPDGYRKDRHKLVEPTRVTDDLVRYLKGEQPKRRPELVPDEYLENRTRRNFKNIFRNIVRDELVRSTAKAAEHSDGHEYYQHGNPKNELAPV